MTPSIPVTKRLKKNCSPVRKPTTKNADENHRLVALIQSHAVAKPTRMTSMEKVAQFGLAPAGNVPIHKDEISGGEDAYRATVVDFVAAQGYDTVLTLSTFRRCSYEKIYKFGLKVFRKLNIKPCLDEGITVDGRIYVEHQPTNSHCHVLLRFVDGRLEDRFRKIFPLSTKQCRWWGRGGKQDICPGGNYDVAVMRDKTAAIDYAMKMQTRQGDWNTYIDAIDFK